MFSVDVPGVSQAAKSAVLLCDLERVKRRLHTKKGIPMSRVEAVSKEYRKYLLMLLANPDIPFPVPEEIDEFGHQHLLFNNDHQKFCDDVGHRIIHEPTVTEEENTRLLSEYQSRTLPVFTKLFGSPDDSIWPRDRCVCKWQAVA